MRWWRRSTSASRSRDDGRTAVRAPTGRGATRVHVGQVALTQAEAWRARCRARGITLEVDAAPAEVVGIAHEIELVVDALLSNAVRCSDRGDRIDITVGQTLAGVVVQVVDTGTGMHRDEIPRVFNRFHRGSLGRDRGLAGAGVGLAVARDIVETHGGRIRAESVAGEGSCFTVVLPPA